MTTHELITALQQARAKMPDAYDLPRSLSRRQVDAHEARRMQLDAFIRGLQTLVIPSATDLYALRDLANALYAVLEQQIVDAPDPTTIADRDARDKAADHQYWLAKSLDTLRGQWSKIPYPLDALLQHVCATCGHVTREWPGSIPEIAEAITKREQKIAEERGRLDALIRGATALLAEAITKREQKIAEERGRLDALIRGATALLAEAAMVDATLDECYSPKGMPADPYQIALAARQVRASSRRGGNHDCV